MTPDLFSFIIGLLIGAGSIFYLKRDEVKRLTDQYNLVVGLLAKRYGHRESVVEAPAPDPIQAEITRLEKAANHSDDEVPDVLARQDDARRLTELKTRQTIEAEKTMAANSSLPPL